MTPDPITKLITSAACSGLRSFSTLAATLRSVGISSARSRTGASCARSSVKRISASGSSATANCVGVSSWVTSTTLSKGWTKTDRSPGRGKGIRIARPGLDLLQLTGLVVDKIRQTRRLTGHEVDFLARHSPGAFKMTLPTANQFPAIAYRKGLSERAYPTYSDFLWDVVPIIRSEIQALVNEGVTYVQIDAPRYSYYRRSQVAGLHQE